MPIGFVTKYIHAWLDYPVAAALIILPFVLGLGDSLPMALWLSVATGVAALILTIFTDHHLGLIRVLPYRFHMAVDLAVGHGEVDAVDGLHLAEVLHESFGDDRRLARWVRHAVQPSVWF